MADEILDGIAEAEALESDTACENQWIQATSGTFDPNRLIRGIELCEDQLKKTRKWSWPVGPAMQKLDRKWDRGLPIRKRTIDQCQYEVIRSRMFYERYKVRQKFRRRVTTHVTNLKIIGKLARDLETQVFSAAGPALTAEQAAKSEAFLREIGLKDIAGTSNGAQQLAYDAFLKVSKNRSSSTTTRTRTQSTFTKKFKKEWTTRIRRADCPPRRKAKRIKWDWDKPEPEPDPKKRKPVTTYGRPKSHAIGTCHGATGPFNCTVSAVDETDPRNYSDAVGPGLTTCSRPGGNPFVCVVAEAPELVDVNIPQDGFRCTGTDLRGYSCSVSLASPQQTTTDPTVYGKCPAQSGGSFSCTVTIDLGTATNIMPDPASGPGVCRSTTGQVYACTVTVEAPKVDVNFTPVRCLAGSGETLSCDVTLLDELTDEDAADRLSEVDNLCSVDLTGTAVNGYCGSADTEAYWFYTPLGWIEWEGPGGLSQFTAMKEFMLERRLQEARDRCPQVAQAAEQRLRERSAQQISTTPLVQCPGETGSAEVQDEDLFEDLYGKVFEVREDGEVVELDGEFDEDLNRIQKPAEVDTGIKIVIEAGGGPLFGKTTSGVKVPGLERQDFESDTGGLGFDLKTGVQFPVFDGLALEPFLRAWHARQNVVLVRNIQPGGPFDGTIGVVNGSRRQYGFGAGLGVIFPGEATGLPWLGNTEFGVASSLNYGVNETTVGVFEFNQESLIIWNELFGRISLTENGDVMLAPVLFYGTDIRSGDENDLFGGMLRTVLKF
ncbi:MAG: hypothetical protein AAGC96_18405 [Pseudomonadota bacterium]